MSLDLEKLLAPVSPDNPCGEDLSYDPAFMELETIAAGKPEQQVGETIVPAEEPDWKVLRQRCSELLARTKDLRVVIHLTTAATKMDGWSGLRDSLALLRGLLENQWEKIYPQLDPEDGNDPLLRMNIISSLTHPLSIVRYARESPLAASKMLGRVGMREIDIATGQAPPSEDPNAPKIDMGTVDGAFADTPIEELQATGTSLEQAIQDVKAIDEFLTKTVGANRAIDFKGFESLLTKARAQVQKYLAKRGVGVAPAEDAGAAGASAGAGGSGAGGVPGQIRSKQDIIQTIDRICDWYTQNEPSSPVPLLLKRAQRLVSKTFLEIIKDLTPDVLPAMHALGGIVEAEAPAAPPAAQ